MVTNLRQTDSKVRITGYLAEKNLERIVDNTGRNVIRGSVTIKTGESNSVQVRVYVTEKTKKGTLNPAWNSIVGVMDNYSSIADVGEENATIISVSGGTYDPRHYVQNGRQVEGYPQYSSSFFRSEERKDGIKDRFVSNMDVEGYVANVRPEFKIVDGEETETGRLICDIYVNRFKGLEKSSFIVSEQDASEFQRDVLPGQTREFYVDIINTQIVTTVHKEAKIGRGRDEEIVRRSREQVLTGISDDYATSGDPELQAKVLPEEAVQVAIREYMRDLEEQMNADDNGPVAKAPASNQPPVQW